MPNRNVALREDELDIAEEIMMNQRMQNIHQSEENRNKMQINSLPPELLRR
jgi:hypothetical protein